MKAHIFLNFIFLVMREKDELCVSLKSVTSIKKTCKPAKGNLSSSQLFFVTSLHSKKLMLNSTTKHRSQTLVRDGAHCSTKRLYVLAQIKKAKRKHILTGTVLNNHHSKCEESTNLLADIFPRCRKEHSSNNSLP